jgi:hypothetical protein
MNKAEEFKHIDDFNQAIAKDLPDVVFTPWHELGSIVEDMPKLSRRLKNNTLPSNKLGLYILGVKPQDGASVIMLYLGIAVGAKSGGVRNRVSNHFSYSQNDTAGKQSGPLEGARAINLRGTYYASYYECTDAEFCDRVESVILYKYDFICNYEKKQVRSRRIPDLVTLFNAGDVDSIESESESINAVEEPVANIRTKVMGLPVRKAKKVVVKESATATAAAALATPTVVGQSNVYVSCGCGKNHTVSSCILSINCACGSVFKFN